MLVRDVLDKHYDTITEQMREAREAAKRAALEHLDIDLLASDPEEFSVQYRAQVTKAFAPVVMRAIADGQRKAQEVRRG